MLATTRCALLRGTTSVDALGDEYGDNASAPVAGYEDFPASLTETSRSEFDVASNTWRTVREYTARLPTYVPVQPGDRIRNIRTGNVFEIDGIRRRARGIGGRSSVTLTLRRTTP